MDIDKIVSKYPLLSAEEELNLLHQYKSTGDKSVRNKLVYHNIRLVLKAAKKFSPKTNDLISEGVVGLISGIDKFDLSRGVKLSTYVMWWIDAHMYQYVISHRIIKVTSTKYRNMFFNLRKEEEKAAANGLDISALTTKFGVDESAIHSMNGFLKQPISIDQDTNASRNLSSDGRPDKDYDDAEFRYLVSDKFSQSLSEREQVIFKKRIIEEMSLSEVGQEIGISGERVRQLEKDIILKLKKFAKANKLSVAEA